MDELVLNFFALKYSMPKKAFHQNNGRTLIWPTFIIGIHKWNDVKL